MAEPQLLPLETTAISPLSEAGHDAIFASHFVEFYLCVHALGCDRKVAGIEPTFRGEKLDKTMVNSVQARLIPDRWGKPIRTAAGGIKRLTQVFCLPGSGEGYYYVNAAKADEFIAAFEKSRLKFDAAVDDVVAAHTGILEHNRDYWRPKVDSDDQYDELIGRLLPSTPEALRACYSVEYRLRSEKDAAVAQAATKYRSDEVREWFNAAFAQAIAQEHKERRRRYREPIERIRQSLSGFRLQLNQGDKLTARSFAAFEESLVLFRVCVDIMEPALVSEVDAIAREMATIKQKAAQVMGDGVGTFTGAVKAGQHGLTDMIDRVTAACAAATSEAVLTDRFGRAPRALRLGQMGGP